MILHIFNTRTHACGRGATQCINNNNFLNIKLTNNLLLVYLIVFIIQSSYVDGFQDSCPYTAAQVHNTSPACQNFASFVDKYLYVQVNNYIEDYQ